MTDNLEPFPLGGPTDLDADDVLVELVGGHAALVPSSARKLPPETKLELTEVVRVVAAINQLQHRLAGHVDELRAAGASWAVIGWALGTTGEAARQRFNDPQD